MPPCTLRWCKSCAHLRAGRRFESMVDADEDKRRAARKVEVERQRRLRSMKSAPPVVQRLLHPPLPPPKPLDPLDEFMQFVNQGGAQPANARGGTRAFVPPKQPGVNVPHTRKGAFAGPMNPTRTGLYHAVQDF